MMPYHCTQEMGEEQENFFLTCGDSIFLIVRAVLTIFYKIIVQGVTLVLAVMIRKVKIPSLDDARYVALMVYVATALSLIAIMASLTLVKYQNIHASIIAASSIAVGGFFLSLLFVPKVNE